MKDKDWINRLVVFRGPLTLGQSFSNGISASVYEGRIKGVFREDGTLFAVAKAAFMKGVPISHSNTNPDPNWTAEQYERRKHHRAIFRTSRKYKHTGWGKVEKNQYFLIKQSQTRWKPHKIIDERILQKAMSEIDPKARLQEGVMEI